MIYFFLRANSFFTLQFLKAISKFQFHAVSNWLLENVLFYLTTVFLLSSFLLINEFIKFFSRRKQKLYRLITPVHLYYSGSSKSLFHLLLFRNIFSSLARGESGIPIRENIFRAKRMIKRLRMLRPVALPSPACSLFGVLLQTM